MRGQADEDFTEFVRAYSTRLLRFAEMLCGDRHQAEDIVQHVLMRCYPKWQRIEGEPLGYVRRAVINRFMSQNRRRWSNERPADPSAPEWRTRTIGDFAPHVTDRAAVLAALAELTPRERTVVVLRYSQDLSEADTAALLGVARGTVKSTCARALGKLRLSPDLIDTTQGGPR
jgi:RNA polymerase sigma-70 factor (sigma-E family)